MHGSHLIKVSSHNGMLHRAGTRSAEHEQQIVVDDVTLIPMRQSLEGAGLITFSRGRLSV